MTKSLIVAGGCFWCVEHDLREAHGVTLATSGYSGGDGHVLGTEHASVPTYENHKGYKEVVLVEYDEERTTFKKLIQFFIDHIDPTDNGGQFGDRGEGYMTAIYYENEDERLTAQLVIKELDESHVYDSPSAIQILERKHFYPAEEHPFARHRSRKEGCGSVGAALGRTAGHGDRRPNRRGECGDHR